MAGLMDQPVEPEPALRLAGTPNMFGDLSSLDGRGLSVMVEGSYESAFASLPLAGGSRRVKIGENNKPLTDDRVYLTYNHFHNAMIAGASSPAPGPFRESLALDRYSFGVEKSFRDGLWSVEVRMPFANQMGFAATDFSVIGGSVGNLAVVLKRMVFETDRTAAAIGVGIDTPTGSEVRGYAYPTAFVMHNEAVHIMPYFGVMTVPGEKLFFEGFVQVDVPTNGNRIDYQDDIAGSGTFGTLNDQTLLYVDLAAGYWLFRNYSARAVKGLAALVELHYASTLQDADTISGSPSGMTALTFGNAANRVDILDLTVGVHAELDRDTLLRVGGVFPLTSEVNRAFDSEVQVQLERRF